MKEMFTKLGLSGWGILFHAINLAILIVALYFLLYKPVKKMIADRKKKLEDIKAENERLLSEADSLNEKYVQMREDALKESAEITDRAVERSNEIIEDARKKADLIVENARKEAASEKVRAQRELHDSVGHIAVEIAGKILEREVNEEDNRRIIEESLSEWEK